MKNKFIAKGILVSFILQLLWFLMFFTNFLGFIGSYSEALQDFVWLFIPIIGLALGTLGFILKISRILSLYNLFFGSIIILAWIFISGISQM